MLPSILPLPLSDATFVLVLVLLLLSPLAIAGLALINTGLGRSRSAAQSLLGNLVIVGVATIVFAVVGATFAGNLAAQVTFSISAGKPWNWLGAGPFFLGGLSARSSVPVPTGAAL